MKIPILWAAPYHRCLTLVPTCSTLSSTQSMSRSLPWGGKASGKYHVAKYLHPLDMQDQERVLSVLRTCITMPRLDYIWKKQRTA